MVLSPLRFPSRGRNPRATRSASRTRARRGIPRIEVRSACCACLPAPTSSSRSRPGDRRDCHGSTRSSRLQIAACVDSRSTQGCGSKRGRDLGSAQVAPRRPAAPVGRNARSSSGRACSSLLPRTGRWSRRDRRASLLAVIRAKAGVSERAYLKLVLQHHAPCAAHSTAEPDCASVGAISTSPMRDGAE